MKLILRVKYNSQGEVIGFYSGGRTHRGMSLKNIQTFYRKALRLGGMSEQESMKYSFHGAKRAHVTFAKNYGGTRDGDVVLGTKHAHGGTVTHYNDASRAQLSKPALFQGELRDRMKAVIDVKASIEQSVLKSSNTNTPPRVPGEVLRANDTCSPTETDRVQQYLDSCDINQNVLREADSILPGASDRILNIAAQIALGKIVRKPRFGLMGSIVRKLGLFNELDEKSIGDTGTTTNNEYNAPVQIFNGPVFFGASSESVQNFMNKRSLETDSENQHPKRRLVQTKEETFFD